MKNVKNYLAEKIEGLRRFSPLLRELVVRDIKVRYRHSVLGLLWTVLNPLLMMTVMTIVFSTLFKSDIEHFPIYYLSASVLFSFNTESTTTAMHSMISNASLIKKVYIPKYLFPLSNVISGMVNLFFSMIAMFIVMIVTKTPFHITLLLIPIPVFYTFLFATGLGIMLSALTVFFRDIAHFYGVFTLVWMYLTPIFYPISILPDKFLKIIQLNPMYHYVSFMRELVLNGSFPSMKENLICLAIGLSMLALGLLVFYKKQDKFVLYV